MRVLILEDDPFIAMDLQYILEGDGHQVVGAVTSAGDARAHLSEDLDYALLDVDVADGKSFAIAEELRDRRIPFAFVSASPPSDIPEPLRAMDFIPKPYEEATILRSVDRCCELVGKPN
ncbi:response regulator [Microvirga brassicacearum]|uniref:Response regulator n=1 Tax=Microvirga brassicacearum TaxID=2580413 RepID=A0A5N3PD36_9HYPH|nr:response regulator [Microvirga brassicacearum]KAB0267649.1 response regulator [Microvirga brassicacearum]